MGEYMKRSEYISREAAQDSVQKHFDDGGFDGYTDGQLMMTRIRDIPAADVVEVVRCGECKYYNDKLEMYADYVCTIRHYCDGSPIIVGKDDFCSSGRRKNGGQEDE